jgi:hypothetical protein
MFGSTCFFAHSWTKWLRKTKRYNRSVNGSWLKGPDGKLLAFQDVYQERECVDCGVIEQKTISKEEPAA